MVEKIKLQILGLSPSQSQTGSFALVLAEQSGNRRLPIIIGMFEAQAIAIEIEQITPNRPMTHDLFKSFATAFDFTLEEVYLSDIRNGVFYAKLICTDGIRQKVIDTRPSDAIAIGLRFGVPIFTTEWVLNEAGISTDEENRADEEEDEQPLRPTRTWRDYSVEELQTSLNEALDEEEYEKAAKIRDELSKRN
jgi:uncharacterized protein